MDTFIEQIYYEMYLESLQNMKVCPSCLESFTSLKEIASCKHELCEECIKHYLKSKVEQGSRQLEDFLCLVDGCSKLINEVELEKWLDFEYFSKLTNRVVFELEFLCPNCQNRSTMKSSEEPYCMGCNTLFCRFCKAVDHEGRCNAESKYFNEVRASIEDEELGYCPECKNPFMKDENCDHVTCQNPECSTEFCFYCWNHFDSINWHGGMYHRTDCRNFEDYGDAVDFYEDCPACLKSREQHGNDVVCQKPDKTRAEFLEEILQTKQINA